MNVNFVMTSAMVNSAYATISLVAIIAFFALIVKIFSISDKRVDQVVIPIGAILAFSATAFFINRIDSHLNGFESVFFTFFGMAGGVSFVAVGCLALAGVSWIFLSILTLLGFESLIPKALK